MRRPKKFWEQVTLLGNGVLKKTVSLSAELDKRPRERKKFETGDVFFRAVFWSDRENPESIRFRGVVQLPGVFVIVRSFLQFEKATMTKTTF